MAKGNKVNIAITIDSWIANWINEQPKKRSTLINQIIKDHITATEDQPKTSQRQLSDLMGDEKEEYMKKHMVKLNAELDRMMELEFSS